MEDVTPGLLKKIQDSFRAELNESATIKGLYEKVRNGAATYAEANDFAIEVGDILARAYKNSLSSDVLPDGRMYFNIAQSIIYPTMKNNYSLITDITAQVQQALNTSANIGIKPITPKLNQDRIDGIINRVSAAEHFDDVSWILDEPVRNFSQSIVDDSIRENAEFHAKAGMTPKIVRKLMGGCCDWCQSLAGTYSYPDVPKDIYRRHQRCRCTVDYNPGNGKIQNVHSKQWRRAVDKEEKEKLREIGVNPSLFSRKEKLNAYNSKSYDNFAEVTGEWYKKADYSVKKVIGATEYSVNGVTYKVDNKHVLMDSSQREKDIAKLIVDTFGGEIQIIPRVVYPPNVSTPDYIYKDQRYDLKEPTGSSKNVLYNMTAKKKSQAANFVFDISNCPLDEKEIMNQIEGLYKSYHTRFIDVIMLVKDKDIINVFKRK